MISVLDWVNQALDMHRSKEATVVCSKQEIKLFVETYEEALIVLTDNGKDIPHSTHTKEAKEIKEMALAQAREAAPAAWECYAAKRDALSKGIVVNRTEKVRIGNVIQASLGTIWQKIVWNNEKLGRAEKGEQAIRKTNGSRSGTSVMLELYQDWDLIPPDAMLAKVYGDITPEGIGTTRRTARDLGYDFDRVSASEVGEHSNGAHGWWRVTNRPAPEAEPEPDPIDALKKQMAQIMAKLEELSET